MTKKKRGILITLIVLLAAGIGLVIYALTGNVRALPEHADVDVWYVGDNIMTDKFGDYTEKFNSEIGERRDITVNAKSFDSEEELMKAVDEGKELPDMVLCSANAAAYINSKKLINRNAELWNEETVASLDSGLLNACSVDGKLICFPVAAESDVLMVNKALFSETGRLDSFEALCDVANEYYEKNGEYFFTVSDYSALFSSAMAQLGEQFDADNPFESDNENVKYIYDKLATAAFKRGYTAVGENPAELVARGELACAVVPAGDVMALENVDSSKVSFMPCPIMRDGKDVYVQRVTGLAMLKADEITVMGAAIFAEWFTEKEINDGFVGFSGFTTECGTAGTEGETEAPAVYSTLMAAVTSMKNHFYGANADYVLKSIEFNDIIDNIMTKSLS